MTSKIRVDYVAIEEEALLKFQFAIIDAMNEAGVSKSDLAKALGVSKARVSQLLDSDANPTLKVIARAMHFLGREVEYRDIKVQDAGAYERFEPKGDGLSSLLAVIHSAEPVWDVHQGRRKASANEDKLWAFYNQAQAA